MLILQSSLLLQLRAEDVVVSRVGGGVSGVGGGGGEAPAVMPT